MGFFETLWLLLIVHALADYPLQGLFLAETKNPWGPPINGERIWVWTLPAHGLVHAGGVYLVTRSLWLSMAEFVTHVLLDAGRCRGLYGFHVDQTGHVAVKVAIALAVVWGLG